MDRVGRELDRRRKNNIFFSFFFYAKKKKKRPDFVRAAQHPAASCFGCYALFI